MLARVKRSAPNGERWGVNLTKHYDESRESLSPVQTGRQGRRSFANRLRIAKLARAMKIEQRLYGLGNGWETRSGDLSRAQPQLVLAFGGGPLWIPPMTV